MFSCEGDSRVRGLIPMPDLFFVTLTERDWKVLDKRRYLPPHLAQRLWFILGHNDAAPKKLELFISVAAVEEAIQDCGYEPKNPLPPGPLYNSTIKLR